MTIGTDTLLLDRLDKLPERMADALARGPLKSVLERIGKPGAGQLEKQTPVDQLARFRERMDQREATRKYQEEQGRPSPYQATQRLLHATGAGGIAAKIAQGKELYESLSGFVTMIHGLFENKLTPDKLTPLADPRRLKPLLEGPPAPVPLSAAELQKRELQAGMDRMSAMGRAAMPVPPPPITQADLQARLNAEKRAAAPPWQTAQPTTLHMGSAVAASTGGFGSQGEAALEDLKDGVLTLNETMEKVVAAIEGDHPLGRESIGEQATVHLPGRAGNVPIPASPGVKGAHSDQLGGIVGIVKTAVTIGRAVGTVVDATGT